MLKFNAGHFGLLALIGGSLAIGVRPPPARVLDGSLVLYADYAIKRVALKAQGAGHLYVLDDRYVCDENGGPKYCSPVYGRKWRAASDGTVTATWQLTSRQGCSAIPSLLDAIRNQPEQIRGLLDFDDVDELSIEVLTGRENRPSAQGAEMRVRSQNAHFDPDKNASVLVRRAFAAVEAIDVDCGAATVWLALRRKKKSAL